MKENQQIPNGVNSKKFIEASTKLYEKNKRLKEVQGKYLELKEELTREIKNFFFVNGIEGAVGFTANSGSSIGRVPLVVRKIQRVDVVFDPDKLEKAIGKDIAKGVISKQYEVSDIQGLLDYVRDLGADPKKIKGFLNVHKTVDNKKLDDVEKLGLITRKQLNGCYTVNKKEPYFTIKEGKAGDGD